jgi:hypothetical protein
MELFPKGKWHEIGPRHRFKGLQCASLLRAIDLWIYDLDLNETKGYMTSDMDCAKANG